LVPPGMPPLGGPLPPPWLVGYIPYRTRPRRAAPVHGAAHSRPKGACSDTVGRPPTGTTRMDLRKQTAAAGPRPTAASPASAATRRGARSDMAGRRPTRATLPDRRQETVAAGPPRAGAAARRRGGQDPAATVGLPPPPPRPQRDHQHRRAGASRLSARDGTPPPRTLGCFTNAGDSDACARFCHTTHR